jgi:hypothetical protein
MYVFFPLKKVQIDCAFPCKKVQIDYAFPLKKVQVAATLEICGEKLWKTCLPGKHPPARSRSLSREPGR